MTRPHKRSGDVAFCSGGTAGVNGIRPCSPTTGFHDEPNRKRRRRSTDSAADPAAVADPAAAAAAAAAAPQPEAPAEPDADQRMAASLASLSAGAGLATLDVCMELVQAVLRRPYDARSREMLVDPLRHPLLDLRPLPRMGIDVQDTNSPPAAASASASASSDERLLRLPFTVPPLDAHALYRSARAAALHLLLSPGVLPETLRSGGGCTAAFVSLLLRYSYNALHSRRTAIPLTNENSRLLWDAGEGLLLSAGGELHSSPASSADGSGSGGSNGAVPVLHLPCRAAAVLHSVGRVLHACKAETCSLHVVEGFGQLLGEGAGGSGACGGSVVCSLAEVEEGVARTVLQSSVSTPCGGGGEAAAAAEPDVVVFLDVPLESLVRLAQRVPGSRRFFNGGVQQRGVGVLVLARRFTDAAEVVKEDGASLVLGVRLALALPPLLVVGAATTTMTTTTVAAAAAAGVHDLPEPLPPAAIACSSAQLRALPARMARTLVEATPRAGLQLLGGPLHCGVQRTAKVPVPVRDAAAPYRPNASPQVPYAGAAPRAYLESFRVDLEVPGLYS